MKIEEETPADQLTGGIRDEIQAEAKPSGARQKKKQTCRKERQAGGGGGGGLWGAKRRQGGFTRKYGERGGGGVKHKRGEEVMGIFQPSEQCALVRARRSSSYT